MFFQALIIKLRNFENYMYGNIVVFVYIYLIISKKCRLWFSKLRNGALVKPEITKSYTITKSKFLLFLE